LRGVLLDESECLIAFTHNLTTFIHCGIGFSVV
jgi:hypothetical protein